SGQPMQPPAMNGSQPEVHHYDLRKGIYSVSINIGKSYQSKLQQGADEIGEFITARPELMPLLGSVYLRYRDFPGAQEMGELLEKVRDKQFPFLAEGDENGAPTLEQAQAQIQAQGQQLQMMQEQLKQAVEMIKTEQVKG